jgi:hypothetical protein
VEKGQKCLVLTMWEEKPTWVVGKIADILELKTQKSVVVGVRKDYQRLVGGNGVIVVPPTFCFPEMKSAGDFVDSIGKALDKFIASYVPEEEAPPLVIDENSTAFGSPLITTASPGLVLGGDQG